MNYKVITLFGMLVTLRLFAIEYPDTPKLKHIDKYHNVEVTDNFQWLEDWSNNDVKQWSDKQNSVTRAYLDKLPNRKTLFEKVSAIHNAQEESYYSGMRLKNTAFFIKNQPPKQHPFLVSIHHFGEKASEKVVFDPNAFDLKHNTAIDWYRVSPDGKFVALALSKGGSEIADLYVLNIKQNKMLDTVIPNVNAPTAGGDLDWLPDSSGFYYTRYPREGEKPQQDSLFYQQLWFHKLGTPPAEDRYEIGKDFPRINEISVKMEPGSGQLLLTMQYGDSGKFRLFLRETDGTWRQLSDYDSEYVQAEFITKNTLLVLSRKNAPRGQLLIWDLTKKLGEGDKIIVPESSVTLASNFYSDPTFIVHDNKIFATVVDGGPSYIRTFSLSGEELAPPKLPPVSGVGQLVPWGKNELMIRQYSNVSPNKWLHLTINANRLQDTSLSTKSTVSFENAIVRRDFAPSKDGTLVPVTIIHNKELKLDGTNPLLLTGYGGYGISLRPYFNPTRKIWLDKGGVIAVANLRGGGEYGEKWHKEGMLTNKQNVFDDFAGVMKFLIAKGYTSPNRLAIEGGSNGGLLMGAILTQHPDLFRVTLSHVGIYDSLRSELDPNGEFNIPEFGTVKIREQFDAMYAYSPYHRVKDGTRYPFVLLLTGENDGRVNPYHSRKMVAALQTANNSDHPILLRTSSNSGHGLGTPLDEAINIDVDRFAFLFSALNME